LTYFK